MLVEHEKNPWVYQHNNPQLTDQSQRAYWFSYLTIIPWARVGYKMVNSPQGRVGYNQSHIQQARME